LADKCNNGNNNQNENCNMIPFVVYGYPMYGYCGGHMMQPGNMCGNFMNPMYFTPYNRPGCMPSDLECGK